MCVSYRLFSVVVVLLVTAYVYFIQVVLVVICLALFMCISYRLSLVLVVFC